MDKNPPTNDLCAPVRRSHGIFTRVMAGRIRMDRRSARMLRDDARKRAAVDVSRREVHKSLHPLSNGDLEQARRRNAVER